MLVVDFQSHGPRHRTQARGGVAPGRRRTESVASVEGEQGEQGEQGPAVFCSSNFLDRKTQDFDGFGTSSHHVAQCSGQRVAASNLSKELGMLAPF